MHRLAIRAGMLPLLAMWLWGCGTSSTAPTASTTDQGQVNALVQVGYGLVDDGSSTSSETQAFSLQPAPPTTFAAIHPVFFWRQLTGETVSWDVTFADTDASGHPTTADVVVHRELLGNLNIMHSIPGDTTVADTVNVIHKPLDDHWVRHVRLKHVLVPALGQMVWRFAGTSLVNITSNTNTTHIQSVHVQSTTVDTVIASPDSLFRLRSILRFQPLDSVRVTVTTNHIDDVVLLHHADHRRLFHNNGDGTYTIKFVTGPLTGWRHFGVDAMSHNTLFDDTAAYDSNRWYIPFVIVTEPVVDYYP